MAPAATVMPLVVPVIEQVPPVIVSMRLTPGTGTSLGLETVMTPEVTKPDSCAVGTAVTVYSKSAVAPLQSGEGADSENLGDIGGVLSAIAGDLEGSDRAPTQPQREVAASANARLDRALKRWDSVQKGELAALNAALKSVGKAQIRVPAEDQVQLHDAPEGKDLP